MGIAILNEGPQTSAMAQVTSQHHKVQALEELQAALEVVSEIIAVTAQRDLIVSRITLDYHSFPT